MKELWGKTKLHVSSLKEAVEKSPAAVRAERAARWAGPASAAGLQGLVALPQQVPPRPEEPGVLRALGGQLLHLGRHGRRRLQDLRQREGGLEGRQRGWGSPAPGTVPEGTPEPPEGSAPHSRRRSASPPPAAAPACRHRAAPAAPTPRSRRGPSGARRRANPREAAAPPRPCPARLSGARSTSHTSTAHWTPSPALAERRWVADGSAAAAPPAPEETSGSCSPAAGTGRIRGRARRRGGPTLAGARSAVAGSGECPGAVAMLLHCCPSAGRGNAPGPAGGPRARARGRRPGWAGPCWAGAAAARRGMWGRRLAQRRGRAKVAAGSCWCPGGRRARAGPAGRDPVAAPARGLCAPEGGRTALCESAARPQFCGDGRGCSPTAGCVER